MALLRTLGEAIASVTRNRSDDAVRATLRVAQKPSDGPLARRILQRGSEALRSESSGAYDDLFSLVDDVPLHTGGAATVKAAQGPVGLADPRLGKLGDLRFTTRMVDDQAMVVAHRTGANIPEQFGSALDDADEGIYGFIRGTRTGNDLSVDMTYVGDQYRGHGLGAAMLEKYGIFGSQSGAKTLTGEIYGPEALTNRVRVFGEGMTTQVETGQAIRYGDIIEEGQRGSYGTFRTQLPEEVSDDLAHSREIWSYVTQAKRRTSTARQAAEAITPDKTIGSGHSSARRGLPRR